MYNNKIKNVDEKDRAIEQIAFFQCSLSYIVRTKVSYKKTTQLFLKTLSIITYEHINICKNGRINRSLKERSMTTLQSMYLNMKQVGLLPKKT